MSLYHKTNASESAARRLIDAGARNRAAELPPLEPLDLPVPPLAGLHVDLPPQGDDEFLAERSGLIADARRQYFTSATALGHIEPQDAGSAEADDKSERGDETEPWARGRAGTHRGRAVHAALQSLPWDAPDETIDAVARAQAVAEAVPDEAVRIASLLRRALATAAATRARTAARALREVPFAFLRDGLTVEGFIDLVIEAPDGSLEVVDWKTDAVPAAAVDRRLQEYRLQAGLYVLGLEAATKRTVSRLTYVFVDPDIERSPGDPRELAAAALQRLQVEVAPRDAAGG